MNQHIADANVSALTMSWDGLQLHLPQLVPVKWDRDRPLQQEIWKMLKYMKQEDIAEVRDLKG